MKFKKEYLLFIIPLLGIGWYAYSLIEKQKKIDVALDNALNNSTPVSSSNKVTYNSDLTLAIPTIIDESISTPNVVTSNI